MGWQFVLVSVSAARQRSQVLDNVYLASALGLDLEGSDHDRRLSFATGFLIGSGKWNPS